MNRLFRPLYRFFSFLYRLWDRKGKIIAFIIILTLSICDLAAMKNLFLKLDVSDTPLIIGGKLDPETFEPVNLLGYVNETNVYPLIMVLLLEGIPYFLGIEISTALDKTTYKVNNKLFATIGSIVSGVGIFLTFVLVIFLRLMVIEKEGGFPEYLGGEGPVTDAFIVQFCLLFTPVLTSILAFVASLSAFKSESAEKLEKKIDKLHIKFLQKQTMFHDTVNRNNDARTALWTSLTTNQSGPIPRRFDDFRKACFERIRSKLIENIIIQYPTQISRYNSEIESTLRELIHQISCEAEETDSYEIRTITPESLIEEYDKIQVDNGNSVDAWMYSIAGSELEKELKKIIDNAVIVAQYKTISRPLNMEGDRY